MQVLSLTTPGTQNLDPGLAVVLQCETNDLVADLVRERPDRFHGLATLATPDRAAGELARAVTTLGLDGRWSSAALTNNRWTTRTSGRSLRRPRRCAPLYLHPQSPPPVVRDAYYGGLEPALDAAFATHGIGWHYETGVQLVRLILAGVFDRFPDLQVITGHWGELVLFYLERIDTLAEVAHLRRRPSE